MSRQAQLTGRGEGSADAPFGDPSGADSPQAHAWDRRAGILLLIVAAWTAYIWGVRAWNLARAWSADPAPAVHATLTVVSLASALVVARIGLTLIRRGRA